MKLIEVTEKSFRVIVKKSNKRVFMGTRDECISFIKGFDRASPNYVDLRLIGPDGEVNWHIKESIDQEVDLNPFRGNILKMVKSQQLLYRGVGEAVAKRPSEKVIRALNSPRRSLSGNDLLNSYMSHNWQEVPRRAYSHFCSQSLAHVSIFGDPVLCIPADDVNLFAHVKTDFNMGGTPDRKSVDTVLSKIHAIRSDMKSCISADDYGTTEWSKEVYPAIRKFDVEKYFNQVKFAVDPTTTPGVIEFFDYCLSHMSKLHRCAELPRQNLINYIFDDLKYALDTAGYSYVKDMFNEITPEKLGITTFSSLDSRPPRSKEDEIWFEGNYLLLMPEDEYQSEHSWFLFLKEFADSRF